MCFNGYMSSAFTAMGALFALWIWKRVDNPMLAWGVFYYTLMEFLQALSYLPGALASDLDDPICDTMFNKVLTILGFLHICLQPYHCHVINCALTTSPTYRQKYQVINRLCLLGGAALFARWLLVYIDPSTQDLLASETSKEWLRGQEVCTFRGNLHLAWSVPMAAPTYYVPGAFIHTFCMFAPFLALYEKKGMVIQGLFLFLTGPVAAAWFTDNLHEQASIWCFFSICQIGIMLFLIRETLIVRWGRDREGKGGSNISLVGGSTPAVTAGKTNGHRANGNGTKHD